MEIGYWRLKDRYYSLVGSRCSACGAEYYPPVQICRRCGSEEISDQEMPRMGEVVTYTILYETLAGFEDQSPIILAIVKLDNDVKVLGQLVDTEPDTVKIGDRVRAVFRRIRADGESGQILYGYKFRKIE